MALSELGNSAAFLPNVLADGKTNIDAMYSEYKGAFPWNEISKLIKDAIVRQVKLEATYVKVVVGQGDEDASHGGES